MIFVRHDVIRLQRSREGIYRALWSTTSKKEAKRKVLSDSNDVWREIGSTIDSFRHGKTGKKRSDQELNRFGKNYEIFSLK